MHALSCSMQVGGGCTICRASWVSALGGRLPGPDAQTCRGMQGILDCLNWQLEEADYRALARLPRQAGAGEIVKSNSAAGLLFAAEA